MNPSTASTAAATSTRRSGTLSAGWSAEDETFFRMVRDLLAPSYLRGASALLASYDPEPDTA